MLFLLIDSWIANYQITKRVLDASKSKNSTEAIHKWNPQLLNCQPNNNTNRSNTLVAQSCPSRLDNYHNNTADDLIPRFPSRK